jgi:glycosyltransferase involved in cell wall biosynthesis
MNIKDQMPLEVEQNQIILDYKSVGEATPFIIVGIPAYNEEKMIGHVVLEAQKYADLVIVCDDGSSDATGKIAKRFGADVVYHRQNLGYGASLSSLFKRARELDADVLVTLDADGQHSPNEIPNIVKPVITGRADLVIGSRFIEVKGTAEMPFYRRIGARLITAMVNGSSKNGISDAQSGFRAYNRESLEKLSPLETGMGASVEILLVASKNNFKICEVPSSCKYNNGDVDTSTENPLAHGIGVVISIFRLTVEARMLPILTVPALLCLFAGLGFGVFVLQVYAIEQYIITDIAAMSVAFILISFLLVLTATTPYAVTRIARKINGK